MTQGAGPGSIEHRGIDHAASAIERVEVTAEPSCAPEVITSPLYTNRGDTMSYTHEVDEKGVTRWFGAKGSPAVFRAQWSDDNTLTGAWEWPGGGYKLTMTRIKGRPVGVGNASLGGFSVRQKLISAARLAL